MADQRTVNLHGRPVHHEALISEGYESPEEYADQGDTRVVRHLLFGYTVATPLPDGSGEALQAADAYRGQEVTIDQIGLINLAKGEKDHAFYTTAELERIRNPNAASSAPSTGVTVDNLSEQGEYELAEWLETEKPTIDEVLQAVGDDKELAHRMLQAENIATDGDPRRGLEAGLTRIIQGD